MAAQWPPVIITMEGRRVVDAWRDVRRNILVLNNGCRRG